MKKNIAAYLCHVGMAFLPMLFIEQANAHEGHSDRAEKSAKPIPGESIYNLKTKWTSIEGASVSLSSLRGRPVVAAMGYTSCESACPVIVEDMKRIETSLPKKDQAAVTFVFFSFDSARDTPARLKDFSAIHKLDLTRWQLFQGTPQSVRALAAVLGISFKKDADGNFDHANVISLIDSDGVVKHQQTGLKQDPKDFQAKLIELLSKPSK